MLRMKSCNILILYFQAEKNYMLREFTSRDEKLENLKVN